MKIIYKKPGEKRETAVVRKKLPSAIGSETLTEEYLKTISPQNDKDNY